MRQLSATADGRLRTAGGSAVLLHYCASHGAFVDCEVPARRLLTVGVDAVGLHAHRLRVMSMIQQTRFAVASTILVGASLAHAQAALPMREVEHHAINTSTQATTVNTLAGPREGSAGPQAAPIALASESAQPSVAREAISADALALPARTGFYMRFTLGLGFAQSTGTGPHGDARFRGLGAGYGITLGGSIAPGLVLAGTLQGTALSGSFKGGPFEQQASTTADGKPIKLSDQGEASATEVGLLIDWYPRKSLGWHTGVSAGMGMVSVINDADNTTWVGSSLSGGIFGGYDWYLGKSWSMGLALSLRGARSATLKDSDGNDTGYRLSALSTTLDWSVAYF